MAEQGGIIYSPARMDPFSVVQLADFSNVQYNDPALTEEENGMSTSINGRCETN
jgi:hypothetical protein